MRMDALETSDSNNNTSSTISPSLDKYSLRPRSLKKRAETELRRQQALQQQQFGNNANLAAALHAAPCTLVTGRGSLPEPTPSVASARSNRPKQKPAPLSKYRRKTANARERSRMREINVAFETLRRAVPHTAAPACASEKLTKITTLRLAMKYISALQDLVEPATAPVARSSCCPSLLPASPLLPTFDNLRGCGSSHSTISTHLSDAGDPGDPSDQDFADHSLLSADFADFPEPSLGMTGLPGMTNLADLVDPCLTAVALTSDDFYDSTFGSEFS